MNPESLETRTVFITKPQYGFSLKCRANQQEKVQPLTPVKSRHSIQKSGLIQGRRLFGSNEESDQPQPQSNINEENDGNETKTISLQV